MVCLANSYKTGGRCIAEVWPAESRYENYANPQLLDIIDVPLLNAAAHNHQTENHVISGERWSKVGVLPWNALENLRDRPPALWINSGHTRGTGYFDCIGQAEAATLNSSLFLIRPDNFNVEVGTTSWDGVTKRSYRGKFHYHGAYYNLRITDPAVRAVFNPKDEGDYPVNNVYLCVSLTEPFSGDGRCHKLVAAVFSEQPLG
jgi:Dual OB-containing domain